jgi:hypothetical protein
MSNLVVLGAGQLGSRHLQSIAQIPRANKIFVVDPAQASLDVAQSRFNECSAHAGTTAQFLTSVADIPSQIDVAIVATNSGPRRKAVEILLHGREVRHTVLEKVLFPNLEDYQWAKSQFAGCSAFVNCANRMHAWAIELSAYVKTSKTLQMIVTGSDLGLACNSIHYIDLFQFFTGRTSYRCFTNSLLPTPRPAKRFGYFEVDGQMICDFGEGSTLTLNSLRGGNVPTRIEVMSDDSRTAFDFTSGGGGTMFRANEASKWAWISSEFSQRFQSQLSQIFVEELLLTGRCELTPLALSVDLHLPLVRTLAEYFKTKNVAGEFDCPIT